MNRYIYIINKNNTITHITNKTKAIRNALQLFKTKTNKHHNVKYINTLNTLQNKTALRTPINK